MAYEERARPARKLLVRETVREADGVLGVVLADPQGADLPVWGPGAHICTAPLTGRLLEVRGPLNRFASLSSPPTATSSSPGASAITPIPPMVRQLAAGPVPWTLLYGGRTLDGCAPPTLQSRPEPFVSRAGAGRTTCDTGTPRRRLAPWLGAD